MSDDAIRAALDAATREMRIARDLGASGIEQAGIVAWRVLDALGHKRSAERVRAAVERAAQEPTP